MSDGTATSRRGFLKLTTAGLAVGALGAPAALVAQKVDAPAVVKSESLRKPRRVIFCVSDGMSLGVPTLAHDFSLLVRNQPTVFRRLLEDKKAAHGYFDTQSLNSMVTDSSAASSAWGSGTRIFNGAVNMLPDGRKLTPILKLLKDMGAGTGLVTTATATHATPAGFAAAESGRGNEESIASQYLGVVDVVFGGGLEFFHKDRRSDKRDLLGEFAAKGYGVATRAGEMRSLDKTKPMLGIFYQGHLPYTIDHRSDSKLKGEVPNLAGMSSRALECLTLNEKGFLLQIEGARIDHAAHSNDAGAILWDQLAFDDAVSVALRYQQNNPDTLVIVTSDHGNSNPGLNGMNSGYRDSTKYFATLAGAKSSYGAFFDAVKAKGAPKPGELGAMVKEAFGVGASDEELVALSTVLTGTAVPEMNSQLRGPVGILGQILGNHTGIGWTGTTHTSDHTLIAAIGPGQEAFNGLIQNREAFGIFSEIFGSAYKNASMTKDEAKPFMAMAPVLHDDAWA